MNESVYDMEDFIEYVAHGLLTPEMGEGFMTNILCEAYYHPVYSFDLDWLDSYRDRYFYVVWRSK